MLLFLRLKVQLGVLVSVGLALLSFGCSYLLYQRGLVKTMRIAALPHVRSGSRGGVFPLVSLRGGPQVQPADLRGLRVGPADILGHGQGLFPRRVPEVQFVAGAFPAGQRQRLRPAGRRPGQAPDAEKQRAQQQRRRAQHSQPPPEPVRPLLRRNKVWQQSHPPAIRPFRGIPFNSIS